VVRQFAAKGSLDDGFLKASHGGIEFFRRDRPLSAKPSSMRFVTLGPGAFFLDAASSAGGEIFILDDTQPTKP
jgi:hypothetical protein